MKQVTCMKEDKYELLKYDAIIIEGTTLYRIRALKDSEFFKAGEIGGVH